MKTKPDNVILLLSDARGIYIPRDFAQDFNFDEDGWQGVSAEDRDTLSDPNNDWYWDTWDTVLNNAHYTDKASGKVYHLHHDGDLWAFCFDSMTDEEKRNFGWEL